MAADARHRKVSAIFHSTSTFARKPVRSITSLGCAFRPASTSLRGNQRPCNDGRPDTRLRLAPLAIAKAMASGKATMPTVNPAPAPLKKRSLL